MCWRFWPDMAAFGGANASLPIMILKFFHPQQDWCMSIASIAYRDLTISTIPPKACASFLCDGNMARRSQLTVPSFLIHYFVLPLDLLLPSDSS